MTRVLAAAEAMLIEVGPERASIPDIAVAADVPRSSIYQFYPDKYALFAHLADIQMTRLAEHLVAAVQSEAHDDWRATVRRALDETAVFYNANALASVLLLRGPFGEQDRRAHDSKDRELARLFRSLIQRDGEAPILPVSPDVTAIAVEIVFAVFRYGYALDGMLSSAIVDQASRAVFAYLSSYSN